MKTQLILFAISIVAQSLNVTSSLAAFTALNKDGTVALPTKRVDLGSIFYIEHTITDSSYKDWYIRNTSITFATPETGGKVNYSSSATSPGRNIYQAHVRFVDDEITYFVTGILLPPNRRFLQEEPLDIIVTSAEIKLNLQLLIRAAPLDVVEVKVPSLVAAFSALNNDGTVRSPIWSLNTGSNFYLEHTIIDSSFKSFYIRNPSIYFATPETGGKVPFTTNVTSPGRNVYQAQAKFVENGITYIVFGLLFQNRRILSEQNEVKFTYASIKFNYPEVSDNTSNTTVTVTVTISTDKNFKKNNNPKALKAKAFFYVKIKLPSKYSKVKIATAQLNYEGKNTGPLYGMVHVQGVSVLTFKATTAMSKKKVTLKGSLTNKLKFLATFNFPTIQ